MDRSSEQAPVEVRIRRVGLAGNPNVGKTTLFNLLTGLRQKVGNYPGVTVERKVGKMVLPTGEEVEVIDLPGTYSLNPRSIDEAIAYEVLAGHLPGEPPPDVIIAVVDASNLERNLYLASQLMDLGIPVIIALNMMDTAEQSGLSIDPERLSELLGVPVVPMVASRGTGVEALRQLLSRPLPSPPPRRWHLMPEVEAVVETLARRLQEYVPGKPEAWYFSEALRALTSDRLLEYWKLREPAFYEAVLQAREELKEKNIPFEQAEVMGRYAWLGSLVSEATQRHAIQKQSFTDRLDAILTHRVWGLVIFLGILMIIFQAVFAWAVPFMDAIEQGTAYLADWMRVSMPPGLLRDLITDGVIAGVGAVVVFLPQILLLFFFLGLLEDTGYMARAAFIMDRIMSRVGLSGKSVVPLLSGYACAIPGIMATRTIDNHHDRLATILVIPLMSCSARLPVYTLFISTFIPNQHVLGFLNLQGLTLFGLYFLGTAMAFIAAYVLKKFVVKGSHSIFVMELPPYRLPQWKTVLWRMVERSQLFVTRAGKIIFSMSIVIWFLATFPRTELPETFASQRAQIEQQYERALAASETTVKEAQRLREEQLGQLADEEAGYRIRHSYIGRLGRLMEPVMRPLGFDWKISAGIVTAFAAREVIISTLATLYSVGDADETSTTLKQRLLEDRYPDGTPVFTLLTAMSLLVFFVLACQCMSTLAITYRETNSWRWPIFMWTYMTLLAYVAALIVYQGGKLVGWS